MATQTFEGVMFGGAVGRLILRPSSLEWRIASAQASASAVQFAFADVSSTADGPSGHAPGHDRSRD